MSLTGSQKRFLRSLAHDLDPVLLVGHQGLTAAVLKEFDRVLEAHELVKVRLAQNSPVEPTEAAAALAEASGAEIAQVIGRVVIAFRPATNPEDRKIRLPAPRKAPRPEDDEE